jgi:hypothetical protein
MTRTKRHTSIPSKQASDAKKDAGLVSVAGSDRKSLANNQEEKNPHSGGLAPLFLGEVISISLSLSRGILISNMRYLHDSNLGYPILLILDDDSKGSGFYLQHNLEFFLITARHVLYKKTKVQPADPDNFVLKTIHLRTISYSLDPAILVPHMSNLDLSVLPADSIRMSDTSDVVAIKVATLSPRPEGVIGWNFIHPTGYERTQAPPGNPDVVCALENMLKRYDDVLISNDVIMFGYPSSLSNIDITRPLLRKGIVAGKNILDRTIIVDCPSFQGNSGGPVIEIDPQTRDTKLIGTVTAFVPFIDVLRSVRFQYEHQNVENSGYSIITPVDAILDLVNNQ